MASRPGTLRVERYVRPRGVPLPRALAIFAAMAGMAGLVGWALDVPALRLALPGHPDASPSSAGLVVVAALSLAIWQRDASERLCLVGAALGAIPLLVGLADVVLHAFPDHARWQGAVVSFVHLPLLVGASFVGMGAALMGLWCGRASQYVVQPLVAVPATLSLFTLVAFGLSAQHEGLPREMWMSFPVALALLALSGGLLAAQRDRGQAALLASSGRGGQVARLLLPVAVTLPMGIGWLVQAGERAGYVHPDFANTLVATATMALLTAFVLGTAGRLDRMDAERTVAEARSVQAMARYRKLIEGSLVGVVVADLSGRVIDANDVLLDILGVSREDLGAGRVDWRALTPLDARPDAERRARELLREGRVAPFEAEHLRADGSRVPLLVTSVHLGGQEFAAFVVDLSPMRQAERARRESEERYRHMVEMSNEGIALLDGTLHVTFANATLEAMIGRGPLLGRELSDVAGEASDRRALLDLFRRAREAPVRETLRLARPDGAPRWYRVSAGPCDDCAGVRGGFLVMLMDETERHGAEERRRAYVRALERTNRDLETFALLASHDLQEPLRKVRTLGDRLARSETGLSPEGQDGLVRIRTAAHRMQALIDDLLIYSRIPTRVVDVQRVDVREVVDDVLAEKREAIEERHIDVSVGNLPTVEADRGLLRQLFYELICNAVKFRRPDDARILVTAEPAGASRWRVVVRDNGIGFDPRHRDRIFGVFQRLHGPHDYTGTGIGLAICKRIAEAHDGSIQAHGEAGKGATFIVELPTWQERISFS